LVSDAGIPTLVDILLYHVFDGIFASSQLSNGPVKTLEGGTVMVRLGDDVMFNNAKAVAGDFLANNGVAHAIDTVLDPADGR